MQNIHNFNSLRNCSNGREETAMMLGWFRNRKNLRYTKDMPPEHSRCDLCFNDFHFPCRTNCGHWLCGTCVLQFSILMDDFRKFKCSKCESQVYNLVPHSPVLTQPGRGVAEVLGEILQFNREHKKEVDLLQSMRGMPDFMLDNLPSVYTLIQYADAVYDFRLWPNGD
ncbi:E3 ubiquitin-protein ligase RNF170-like [Salvia splendens]|uniref:E3 ubiquitin-protein ligase RNF170-like n=1 Tax=Salvia splendens TaxID=180675 RepID=UPI001C25E883|nr:E3 ubiquitin-protein ligase RNF170-like [Salvia splendens]